MKKIYLAIIIVIVVALAFFLISENNKPQIERSIDQVFNLTPISHATFVLTFNGNTIYVDPVGGAEAFSNQPTADLVLITDNHGDHLNIETLQGIDLSSSSIIAPQVVFEELPQELQEKTTVIANDETTDFKGIMITAIPMYNLPESDEAYHVKGRGNGYILGDTDNRIYIAGDTSDTPEMRALENIDVAFIPMNLPYTMTIESAADGVLAFEPKIVYPYHYRGTEGFADVEAFKELVESQNPNIEVKLLEWYPEQTENTSNNSNEDSSDANNDTADNSSIKTYEINNTSTVSYTVQKEYFGKPVEAVVGTTNDLSGEIVLDSANKLISTNAQINPSSLKTDSDSRDKDVRKLFNGPITVNVKEVDFKNEGQVSFTAPVSLTINNITKTVNFSVSGTIEGDSVSIKGNTSINMKDFAIDPPSAVNVYAVDEVALISFELKN